MKNKKLLIFVNDLSFFCSHRLPIAEAYLEKELDVCIAYGELGGADKIYSSKKVLKLI